MLDRIIGVFRLDVHTFEEIEHDTTATGQAAGVVVVAAIFSGIGGALGANVAGGGVAPNFLATLVSAVVGWVLWSWITYAIGTGLFDGRADLGEMLRVIGFAYAPQILAVIPCLGALVGAIWSLVAGFIAVRQGLDLDNAKAFLTVFVGFLVYVVLSVVVGILLGGMSMLT